MGTLGRTHRLQVIGVTALTSGFWTIDNLEYFSPEVGAGVTYTLADQIQFHMVRNRCTTLQKALGASSYVGVRYLFD